MKVYSNAFYAMNTRFVFVLPGLEQDKGDVLFQEIKDIVERWEQRLSRFNPDADIYQINLQAKNNWVKLPDYMLDLLHLCEHYHHATMGLFDPSYASVYDSLRAENKISEQEIKEIKAQCGWNQLNWDKELNAISFPSEHFQFDFGSLGKGIALKEVTAYLNSQAIKSAFISFGESSMAGIGTHPFGTSWPLSLSHSIDDSDAEISLIDESVSISGMQFKNEKLQAHIYHPLNSQLVQKQEILLVKCKCPIQAEILSTAAYIADSTQREQFNNTFPEVEIIWKENGC